MGTIQKDIAEKQAEAQRLLTECANLTKLQELYPDLRKLSGRWNKEVYCSKEVNSKVTSFDSRHNCGCCADSPLEIWPYLETEYGRVYSDPSDFRPGERVDYAYDRPYSDWQKKMRDAGIATVVIDAVEKHFETCEEERQKMEDEEDD